MGRTVPAYAEINGEWKNIGFGIYDESGGAIDIEVTQEFIDSIKNTEEG